MSEFFVKIKLITLLNLTLSDPGYFRQLTIRGGGFKSPPPYDLENCFVNLHHIIHVNRSLVKIGVFGMIQLEFFKNSRF